LCFEASPGKKFVRPHVNQWMGTMVSYVGKHKLDCGPPWPRHKVGTYLKVTKAKRAGSVVQAVEHLPSKHKAQ
jgi:hypothetical protein